MTAEEVDAVTDVTEGDLTSPLVDPDFYAGDPFPLYARLRAEAPLARNDRLGFWVASRHAEVVTVSRDPDTFCSGKGIMVFEIGAEYPTPPTMMHTDPPAHTRYRALVQPGFRPSFMGALEEGMRRRARILVEKIETGVPVDFVSEVAVPLPLQVISDLLGIPEHEWPRFFRWSEAVIPGATDWPEEERQALSAEMVGYLLAAAAERRSHPGEDIISALGAAEVDGDRLSDDELAMFLVQLLVAGNETTRNMMSGGLVAFADTPGSWASLRPAVSTPLRGRCPWPSKRCCGGRRRWSPSCARRRGRPTWPACTSRRESRSSCSTPRPTATNRCSGPRPIASTLLATPIRTWLSGSVPTSASGPCWPVWRVGSCSKSYCARFGSVERAGPVVRTPSPVIAGVRSAPLVFRDRVA